MPGEGGEDLFPEMTKPASVSRASVVNGVNPAAAEPPSEKGWE